MSVHLLTFPVHINCPMRDFEANGALSSHPAHTHDDNDLLKSHALAKSNVKLFNGWPANRPSNAREYSEQHIVKATLSVNPGMLAEMIG